MYCDKGLSLGEIAQLAGTTKSHVHYYMAKFDIDRRPWTGLAPKVDPSVILSLYKDQGKTLDQISIALGISRSTAWEHISRQTLLRPKATPRIPRAPFSGDEFERSVSLGLPSWGCQRLPGFG